MQSHELLREVFDKSNPKEVADALKISLSMVYKWAQPTGNGQSGATNPLDRIEILLQCTQDPRLLQWICERGGGFFIQNPEGNWPHPFTLIPATNKVVQEFADLLSVVANAAGDNHISKDESTRIRNRWEQLKTVTEGFVQSCENGNFKSLLDKEGN